jgi:dolichol-phosphate mannosyltransferase
VLNLRQRLYRLPLVGWVLRHRFPRFALVGSSGTLVNLAVLYAGNEYLFRAIATASLRLNLALALAVFVATINNFAWNRLWTWRDRRADVHTPILLQFVQYGVACWLGILLQFVITTLLARHVHYLFANLIAIAVASGVNFVVNDNWTFGRLRILLRRARERAHAAHAGESFAPPPVTAAATLADGAPETAVATGPGTPPTRLD